MTVENQDIVTLDHYGKRRMGVVLQVGIVPGGAAVAIGYGTNRQHDDRVRVTPESHEGHILRIYKPTAFYAGRTLVISLDKIYPTGRKCPQSLFVKLEPFLGGAIMNSYRKHEAPNRPQSHCPAKKLTATLGELLKGKI